VSNLNRRSFVSAAVGVLALGGLTAQAEERKRTKKDSGTAAGGAGGDLALPMVDAATDPMAKSVNFAKDHKDVTKADIKVEKQGVSFEKQHCSGCMLYSGVGKKDGAAVGKCTLFAGKLVSENSWCTSWAKKA
jgi:High potential iron-sulfur protein